MMKNLNMYDVITDGSIPPTTGSDIIAITNNITCGSCDKLDEFVPMFLNSNVWLCVQCWEKLDNDMSDNMRAKLADLSKQVQYNNIIRNM